MFLKRLGLLAAALCVSGVAQAAADWTVSAELRERYQSFNNFDYNSNVDTNTSELDTRLFLKAKGDFGNGLTVFFQPQAVLIQNKSTAAFGTQDFSQADLLQAYLEYQWQDLAVRVGRQQLAYGDQRLLGYLGWKDVARTFDGMKAMYHNDGLSIDAFAVHPADIGAMTPTTLAPQGQSLVTWEDRSLMGFYSTYKFAKKTGVDAYFMNWSHSQQATVGKGRSVNTYGLRGFAVWNAIDVTAEAALQSGDWVTNTRQSASAFAVKAGYTFDAWNTRLGIEYDFSPGDDKTTAGTHKNFVFPFHTNHAHYGEMDRFSWANMKDLRFSVKTSPTKGLTMMVNAHLLSLDKAQGDWLNVVGAGVLSAGAPTYTQTKAGTEVDVKVIYKVAAVQGLKLIGQYGVFNPGAAVSERNAGKADSAQFGYLVANYAF
ncbi:MAG: alginate export family protein [Mariprofundaceae bacterium]|nr:alginate export family protein [Mariprofundaceae bacterium]